MLKGGVMMMWMLAFAIPSPEDPQATRGGGHRRQKTPDTRQNESFRLGRWLHDHNAA
jgi:hypothetical protein